MVQVTFFCSGVYTYACERIIRRGKAQGISPTPEIDSPSLEFLKCSTKVYWTNPS